MRTSSVTGTAKGALKLSSGVFESLRILRRFRPDVVFVTGGYGSVGVGLVSRLLRLPLLLFLPDVQAGAAVRTLVRVATKIAVTVTPAEASMPPAKTLLTGYPVRPAFFEADRDAARRAFGLDATLPTLLVTGGSTGASRINRAVAGWAKDFLTTRQLLHVSGHNDYEWLQEQRNGLPEDLRGRYHLHDYLHDGMANAFAAADLGVMRAGASTLGELPATRLPAVLIPGDFSDQDINARYLENEGAAVGLPESQLDDLYETVSALLDEPSRLAAMRDRLALLARPEAADRLAALVMEMAGVRPRVPA
jgi:UDP-N-acetylglucosamine--N-acetylmuramyl-(pentapeptide) pyrophosphoryl-undecaprenol N-acetylglucosamine transferase